MGKRILIIDDNDQILEILKIILVTEGYYMVTLLNSGVLVEDLMTIQPDLILLDVPIIESPKRGNEICAELKSHH